jgi:uncharacterized membrane protein
MSTLNVIVAMSITGGGVITGLLFAFSNFVMQALDDLPNEQGMFVMQRINEKIINPIFLTMFLGTPLLCLGIAMKTFAELSAPGSLFLLAGALGYLIGPFGITILFNVPLNNRLAQTEPGDAPEAWPNYRKTWQRWNHMRTYIGIFSIMLLTLGLAAKNGV